MLRMFLALLLFATATSAAAEPWRMAESEHFRIFGQRSEAKLAARAALIEDFRGLLLTITDGSDGAAAAPKLDIYLLDSIAQSVPFGRIKPGIAGYYSPSPGGIVAYAEENVIGDATLLHEYAHHFMLGGSRAAYPAWYVEGFAEYFMTARFTPEHLDFGDAAKFRMAWLVHGRWVPLDRMLARNFRARSADETAMFYAQSWLLTHYLYRAPEMKGRLVAYLKAVAGGADPVAAFRQHIDPNPRGFDGRLRGYVQGPKFNYSRYPRTPAEKVAVKVTTLSPAADPLLLIGAVLERGLDFHDYDPDAAQPQADDRDAGFRTRILAAVRQAAGRWPDDALARRTLALAELSVGDLETARALLDTLLLAAPADAELLRWRALAEIAAVRPLTPTARTTARRLLARSFTAAPNDWRTLHFYAMLVTQGGLRADKGAADVAMRAWELAPQVSRLVVDTAIVLAANDRLGDAAAVLARLANAPHRSPAADRAACMADAARAADKPAFFAALRLPDSAFATARSAEANPPPAPAAKPTSESAAAGDDVPAANPCAPPGTAMTAR